MRKYQRYKGLLDIELKSLGYLLQLDQISIKVDKILIIALLLGLVFCFYGIHWGWVEEWNPDQMAFQSLFNKGELPFDPIFFEKPPFHTYFNFFLSTGPFYLIKKVLPVDSIDSVRLLWSRALTVFLFLGSVALVFHIAKRFFGFFAARIITIVFSTSAGFIAFSHFLTADIPVMFWMLVAFYFAQNILFGGKKLDYVLAGLFTGIATATKYNALPVGIAIVMAHGLSINFSSWKKLLLDKKLLLGLLMVAIGFLLGNPFAVLDYSHFISDFMYSYIVTPVYGGIPSEDFITYFRSYRLFIFRIVEIIGLPSFFLFLNAFLFSFYFLFTAKGNLFEKKGILLLISVSLLYYFKVGSFPRIPARFVMPVVPLLLIMSGPFWNKIRPKRIIVSVLLVIIISYNLICSFYVGKRFTDDPHTETQEWVKENIPQNSSIESTSLETPHWNKIPGVNLKETVMPRISGRGKLLEKLSENSWVKDRFQDEAKEDNENEKWYDLKQLMKRRPDYIAIDSGYYNLFIKGHIGKFFPSVKNFFVGLIDQKYPYEIVFDRESKNVPSWIYPREIDFLDNRIIIFKKKHSRTVVKR